MRAGGCGAAVDSEEAAETSAGSGSSHGQWGVHARGCVEATEVGSSRGDESPELAEATKRTLGRAVSARRLALSCSGGSGGGRLEGHRTIAQLKEERPNRAG